MNHGPDQKNQTDRIILTEKSGPLTGQENSDYRPDQENLDQFR